MNMQLLSMLTNYILVALLFTAIWAPVLIALLYRFNLVEKHILAKDKMNAEFMKIHGSKSGTPNNGGLMITGAVVVLALVLLPQSALRDLFILGWFTFGTYGFVEGVIANYVKRNPILRSREQRFGWRMFKLGILFLLCLLFISLMFANLNVGELTLIGDLKLPVCLITIGLLTLGMGFSMYAMEITDGADGLVTGLFLIGLVTYVAISTVSGHTELLPILGLLIGACVVYLYFNIKPARVFMGGVGTFPVSFSLVMMAFITDSLVPFIIMAALFWVELFSSASQMIWLRVFKKKLWKIAPIHHYFEAIGWPETKVVQRFWLFAAVAALVALWVYTLLPN